MPYEKGPALPGAHLEDLDLSQAVPPDSPGHPTEDHTVRACLNVILDEEWEHNRYARRDPDILG